MIPDIAFASVLALSAALTILVSARTRAGARDYLRFAAALFAALALADLTAAISGEIWSVQFAQTVGLIVAALAPAMLALAIAAVFEAPLKALVAAPILVFACLAGFAAAITGEAFIAVAPLAASVCAMLALSARRWRIQARAPAQVCISALALLAGAAALASGDHGRTAFALFCAAALLGVSLATTKTAAVKISERAVEQKMPRFDWRVRGQS
jgi:hypothetical protein